MKSASLAAVVGCLAGWLVACAGRIIVSKPSLAVTVTVAVADLCVAVCGCVWLWLCGCVAVGDRYTLQEVEDVRVCKEPDLFKIKRKKGEKGYTCQARAQLIAAFRAHKDAAERVPCPTFAVRKLSSTRGSVAHPEQLDVLLAVRRATLERLNPDAPDEVLSSKPLLSIIKIQILTNEPDGFLMFWADNKVQRYWSDDRDAIVRLIAQNLGEIRGADQLAVERMSGEWDEGTAMTVCWGLMWQLWRAL